MKRVLKPVHRVMVWTMLLTGVLGAGTIAKADKVITAVPEQQTTTQQVTTAGNTLQQQITEQTTEKQTEETIIQGWNEKKTSYYIKGKKVTGVKKINGKLYYFKKNGNLYQKTGMKKVEGKVYYFTRSHTLKTGIVKVKGRYYYFDKKKGARYEKTGVRKIAGKYYCFTSKHTLKTGWYRSDKGNRYYFNPKTFAAVTGWKYIDSYKYNFKKNGQLNQDVRKLIKNTSSYCIKVNRTACCVTVYAKDGWKGYTIPVVSFVCSSGNDTPTGTFYTGTKYRWQELFGPCWGQWCTQITGNILFHSVYYNEINNNRTLSVSAYNKLGTMASHGCIRLCAGDAKWLYDNCASGTKVVIYNDSSNPGPFDKPVAQKLSADHTWDPTDPTIQ